MLRSLVLYTALTLGANVASAADLKALATGGMKNLVVYDTPIQLPDVRFTAEDGQEVALSHYRGKVILVNFWATWCVPCREEMPALDALQQELGGDDFEVLTIASGRNPVAKIDRFFAAEGVSDLPKNRDEKQQMARAMGVLGLPVTVVINAQGAEVARLIGGADWAGADARHLIEALVNDG
ncbi:TlpA family protein disulfide reductase [Rhodobacteraceae bacterium]|nr:TlpA family protein disulfide reductase [Paracoccaceae bacterium]